MVPLIKRRLTGQIAGMTGAYGNVGAVFYLTVLSMVSYRGVLHRDRLPRPCWAFLALLLLEEPKGHMVEVNEDGSVELIKVNYNPELKRWATLQ